MKKLFRYCSCCCFGGGGGGCGGGGGGGGGSGGGGEGRFIMLQVMIYVLTTLSLFATCHNFLHASIFIDEYYDEIPSLELCYFK